MPDIGRCFSTRKSRSSKKCSSKHNYETFESHKSAFLHVLRRYNESIFVARITSYPSIIYYGRIKASGIAACYALLWKQYASHYREREPECFKHLYVVRKEWSPCTEKNCIAGSPLKAFYINCTTNDQFPAYLNNDKETLLTLLRFDSTPLHDFIFTCKTDTFSSCGREQL